MGVRIPSSNSVHTRILNSLAAGKTVDEATSYSAFLKYYHLSHLKTFRSKTPRFPQFYYIEM